MEEPDFILLTTWSVERTAIEGLVDVERKTTCVLEQHTSQEQTCFCLFNLHTKQYLLHPLWDWNQTLRAKRWGMWKEIPSLSLWLKDMTSGALMAGKEAVNVLWDDRRRKKGRYLRWRWWVDGECWKGQRCECPPGSQTGGRCYWRPETPSSQSSPTPPPSSGTGHI